MIVAEAKSLERIKDMLKGQKKVLVAGCNTCMAVCFAGGEKEAAVLATSLRMAFKFEGVDIEVSEKTVERQCENEFIEALRDEAADFDAILSLACGAGVNALADIFADIVVYPGVDTKFIGVTESAGVWASRCSACGECILDQTAGICPINRCAKSLLHGPCGGSQGGFCEVSKDIPCVWQLIVDRMKRLNLMEKLGGVRPPKDWSAGTNPSRVTKEEKG
ncbi:MAG: methylenetetrahydrofolate reductase C-terminal domain-containing protein [Actinomycetota bacterium]|nr:methylenetetrahydrofolate reductase C-terminal domain-containing protein [Actinomycetota bacterium]